MHDSKLTLCIKPTVLLSVNSLLWWPCLSCYLMFLALVSQGSLSFKLRGWWLNIASVGVKFNSLVHAIDRININVVPQPRKPPGVLSVRILLYTSDCMPQRFQPDIELIVRVQYFLVLHCVSWTFYGPKRQSTVQPYSQVIRMVPQYQIRLIQLSKKTNATRTPICQSRERKSTPFSHRNVNFW